MVEQRIRLVVSDVDGTLVGPDHHLGAATLEAAAGLAAAGIPLALVSSRPPRGMVGFVDPLALTAPLTGFNGAMTVTPSLEPIDELPVPAPVAAEVLAALSSTTVELWAFEGSRWLVADPDGARVQRHAADVGYEPEVVDDVAAAVADRSVTKLVGVSDDHDAVAEAERRVRAACAASVSATRSQPCYLDVTVAGADKGSAVRELCRLLDVDPASVLAIGDGANDVAMFEVAGTGVAMGNAAPEVQSAATFVTGRSADGGWASALVDRVLAAPTS